MTTRAQKVREAVRRVKLMPSEQERVAENMWRILQDAEDKGVRKAAVLHEGGAGGEGDSTKRLARFALDPSLDATAKKARAARLTKGAEKYLRVAEAAGNLARKDRDAYVIDLFSGTRFTAPSDAPETEDLYVELSSMIRFICAGVARKHDLQRIFKLCDERDFCYFHRSPRKNPDGKWSKLWSSFVDGGSVSGLIDYDGYWSMPYPSILIGWTDLVRWKDGQYKGGLPFKIEPDPRAPEPATPVERDTIDGAFKLEIRLALLPLGPGGAVEPAFITSFWTAIEFGSYGYDPDILLKEGRQVRRYHSSYGVPENLAERWLPGRTQHYQWVCEPQFEESDWIDQFQNYKGVEPLQKYGDAYGSSIPLRIDLVSPSSCHRYFSLLRSEDPVTGIEYLTVFDDLEPALMEHMNFEERYLYCEIRTGSDFNPPEDLGWRSEPGTLAQTMENALYQEDEPYSFGTVLNNACARYVKEVTSTLQEVDKWRNSKKLEIYKKWSVNIRPIE